MRPDVKTRIFNDINNQYDDDWNLYLDQKEGEKKSIGVLK